MIESLVRTGAERNGLTLGMIITSSDRIGVTCRHTDFGLSTGVTSAHNGENHGGHSAGLARLVHIVIGRLKVDFRA